MNEAGGSAQRRYERQRRQLADSLPANRFWRFVEKRGDDYKRRLKSANAWGKGAEGERLTARAFEPLEAAGWILLNDLPLPGRKRANIDHVLIGPPGVYVVETKHWKGRGRIERSRLVVNGRDRRADLDEVWREAGAVQYVLRDRLARLEFDVRAVICVHNTELARGLFREPEIAGVRIGSPRKLVAWFRSQHSRIRPEDVESLAKLVAEANR